MGPEGCSVDEQTLDRIRALAIPPAWTDVWICPDAMGHLQASGTDGTGRRQYLYHDRWRARRDAEKFDRMRAFAHRLPQVRARVAADLGRDRLPREKALAVAVRSSRRGPCPLGQARLPQHRADLVDRSLDAVGPVLGLGAPVVDRHD